MRLLLRFGAPLFAALAVLAALLTPLADHLIARWFQNDVEMRSRLVFSSVRDSLAALASKPSPREIKNLFERISEDERVLAVGWCNANGKLQVGSANWPKGLACPASLASDAPLFQAQEIAHGPVLSGIFPLAGGDGKQLGQLIILNDLSFIDRRSSTARLYLMGFLAVLSIVAAGVTVLMAQLTLRGWIRSVRQALNAPVGGYRPKLASDPQLAPMMGEIRQLLRDLDISRRTATGIRIDWSPETLRNVLDNELPGVEVLVLSNREPYIHNFNDAGQIVMQRPASGLVTALEPIMRACKGTWVAHGSGSADQETCDAQGHVAVPPGDPVYTLRRVWLTEEEQNGYYYGLSNEGLWPLCHITYVRPVFREPDWEQYVAVNRKFADAVVREAQRPDPLVLVQDYHFALAPRMIRERLPNATIITFWHIPWPNSEVFGICPWREAIINGLLGSSVIGFHTQLHCNNFIETADRFIECHIDREEATVSVGGHSSLVRPYPISIDWPPAAMVGQAPTQDCRKAVLARFDMPSDTLLAVGVERFDFTKGIPDRFRAVEILLERHPEWIGRFVLLQVAAPSRSKLPVYQEIQRETQGIASEINRKFGRGNYKPILLVAQHHEPEQVYELFRAANLCIVSSLHDGMNLVAKEFVAARDDEEGVLILSTFAGASRELMEALIVNPFDARVTADAIDHALRMPVEQQAERMHLMREMVSENNVYYWAGRMLLDASRIRKRERIESNIAKAGGAAV
ncbi:Trehalose-6-phosphate synthase [Rhodospirillaceae bacterium LM-1]|nr:Trehalose-6-phosphate synthase [Rhodospirillaceae bacterium LM-1]